MKTKAIDYASARIRSSARGISRVNILLVTIGVILGIYAFALVAGAIKPRGPANRMKRALSAAARASIIGGYPTPGWPNPYHKVLRILRVDGKKLSPRCKADALTRYAGYIGSLNPFSAKPHPGAWYKKKEESILLHAVKICPKCPAPWVALALMHEASLPSLRRQTFDKYLAGALRADPNNRYANDLRALEIFSTYGGHWIRSGIFHGDAGFDSEKWTKVFCYRSLIALGPPARGNTTFAVKFEGFPFNMTFSRSFLELALKYYVPRQLAELQAGTWKPGPCPDPFPPPIKKPAHDAAGTAP